MEIRIDNFIKIYERSFIENWDLPALTNYVSRKTLTYGDMATVIARIHLFYESAGIRQGAKIAICGKDSPEWVLLYIATVTYGAVVVPILSEFNPVDITHIVNHSGAELLFVSSNIWEHMEPERLLKVKGVMGLEDRDILYEKRGEELSRCLHMLRRKFRKLYPSGYRSQDIRYADRDNSEVVEINYTSGTTGFRKG